MLLRHRLGTEEDLAKLPGLFIGFVQREDALVQPQIPDRLKRNAEIERKRDDEAHSP